jgi:transcriptional regulator with XRE-family HTH domain
MSGVWQPLVVEDQRLGALVRGVRLRRGLRQADLGRMCGVAQTTISLVERNHWESLSVRTLRKIAAQLDVRVDVIGRWRGGDADRLLSRRHSGLAQSVAASISAFGGWVVRPEVSFSIYGERGIIDQLCWHAETAHLLVIELKTEFVDMNDMLGVLDRKARLARTIAHERGVAPQLLSVWLIASDSSTNRHHAREHAALIGARFPMDGRSFAAFLRKPTKATSGLAFWSVSNRCAAKAEGAGARSGRSERQAGN